MKVEFHIKDVSVTQGQKALIESKLRKLKRYLKEEPISIDVYLRDESSPEKGGVDKAVELSTVFCTEKFFVREVDNEVMRAFAHADKTLEQNLIRFHKKRIDKNQRVSESRISKILRALKLRQ